MSELSQLSPQPLWDIFAKICSIPHPSYHEEQLAEHIMGWAKEKGLHAEQSIVVPQLPPASQVLADVMLSHWPISAWQPQLPKGWTLTDTGDRRELRNASGKLVTEIVYLQRKGKREPISIEQHVFKYHITIQYLGD